jgi:hypothetical protein
MKKMLSFVCIAAATVAQQGGVPAAVVADVSRSADARALVDEIELVGRGAEPCAVTSLGADGVEYLNAGGARRADWLYVVRVKTARPVSVLMANGDRATAKLGGVEAGRLKLESSLFGTVTVAVGDLVPLPSPALPQDPAKPKTPLTAGPWKGNVSLSGSFRSGNTDQVLGALRAAAERNWEYDKLSFALEALYGKSEGTKTNESLFVKGRWDHFWSEKLYGYAQLDALHDQIQDIDVRAVASVGVGYVVWKDSDDELLALEGGVSGIYTRFGNGDDPLSPAARAAATFKEIIFKDVRFTQEAEFLLPIDDPSAFLVRARTALGVPLAEGWAMKTSLDVNYTADPAVGRRPFDILFLVGIEYQF